MWTLYLLLSGLEQTIRILYTAEEGLCATNHKRIFVARPYLVEVKTLETILVCSCQSLEAIEGIGKIGQDC